MGDGPGPRPLARQQRVALHQVGGAEEVADRAKDAAGAAIDRAKDLAGDVADASKGVARGVSSATKDVVDKAKDIID